MTEKKKLGVMLVEAGLISEQQIEKALKLQVGGTRRLGYLLIKMGMISEDQLQATLSEQLGLPIIDIDTTFNPAIKRLLPRYLCKKYNVIPLDTGDDNILKLAMVDPSDTEAIADIENFTGMVVEPCLASQSAINQAIHRHIPWSFRDLFNPLTIPRWTIAIALVALVLVVITILQYRQDQLNSRFGTQKTTATSVLYQNHGLILEFDQTGKAHLQGRGAYAQGSYSITFDDLDGLQKFIQRKKEDFSEPQLDWLKWVLTTRQQH